MLPTFEWTISFGQIVQVICFVLGMYGAALGVYHKIDKRMASFEHMLNGHATTLTDHAARLARYEEILFKIVGDLQRVVGRVEMHSHHRQGD